MSESEAHGHDKPYHVLWESDAGFVPRNTRILQDMSVLAISKSGDRLAIFNKEGEKVSEMNVPWRIHEALPSRNGGGLYMAGEDIIYKSEMNGNVLWQRNVGHRINDWALSSNRENVIVATEDKYLYIIGAEGEVIQRHRSSEAFNNVSAPCKGDIISSSSDVSLFLLTEDGEIRWTYKLKWPVSLLQISPNSRFIVASALSEVYCFDPQQRIKWRKNMESMPVMLEISGNDRMLFIVTKDNHILAYALEDGRPVWKKRFDAEIKALSVSRKSTYLMVVVDNSKRKKAIMLDYAGQKIWSHAQDDITDAAISDDGSVVCLSTESGRVVAIENLHISTHNINALLGRMGDLMKSGMGLNDLMTSAKEALALIEEGKYKKGREAIQDIERMLMERERDAVLTLLPEIQSGMNELKSSTSETYLGTIPEWDKLKKVFDGAIGRMEKGDYYKAYCLSAKAKEYIENIKEKLVTIMEERKIEDIKNRIDTIKTSWANLPEGQSDINLDAEIVTIENHLQNSRLKEALDKLRALEDRIKTALNEAEKKIAEGRLEKALAGVERARAMQADVFDAESLLEHAKKAFEDGDYKLVGEYINEVQRIIEARTKGLSPASRSLKGHLEGLQARIEEYEEKGIIMDGIRKMLMDAEEYLEMDNTEKAESLIKRAEDDMGRTIAAVEELRGKLAEMEATLNNSGTLTDEALSRIEEARFAIAAGDLSRARMLVKRLESDINDAHSGGSVNDAQGEEEATRKETGVAMGDGARICPNCGAEVPSDFQFCGKCGTRLG